MGTKTLETLLSLFFPKEVSENFDIVSFEYFPTEKYDEPELHIHLDEKAHKELMDDFHFESKGFASAVEVTDFPIRDHKVILILRRRRWVDVRTGKSFTLPLSLTADGTRYSKEFAAFLKETYGQIPDDLPYA